jgi:hypothetical protein
MATDTPPGASQRPRPWLLVLLGLAIVAYVLTQMFSGGTVTPAVTTTGPRPANPAQAQRVDPEELDVRIEALESVPEGPADEGRNPFRFQPKPPPPPQVPPSARRPDTAPVRPVPEGPPPPPPIGNLIKFIGIVETGKERIGAFSDCRYTFSGREGEIIEGRFRVVRIGVESAVLEYADGKGRTTLPLNGQACVGK